MYGYTVSMTAVQFDDGSIDAGRFLEPPRVWINTQERGLTDEQARALAAALLEVCEEIDGWR